MPLFLSPTHALKKALFKSSGPIDWKRVEHLLNKGANPNIENKLGYTPLMMVLYQGPLHLCQVLLEKGVNPNHRSKNKETVLHFAVERGDVETCAYLLKNDAKASINEPNADPKTALGIALERNRLDIGRLLLSEGITPLEEDIHSAFATQNFEACKLLLEFGVQVKTVNEYGQTPLMMAIQKHNTPMMDLLLNSGVDVNAQDQEGHTALMGVSLISLHSVLLRDKAYTTNEQIQVIQTLLAHGADLNLQDKNGKTAEDLVRGLGFRTLAQFLQTERERQALEGVIPSGRADADSKKKPPRL